MGMSAIIVFLQDYPWIILAVIELQSLSMMAFILAMSPFKKGASNIKGIFQEIILIVMNIFFFGMLLIEDLSDFEMNNLGWMAICALLILTTYNLYFICVDVVRLIIKISKWILLKVKSWNPKKKDQHMKRLSSLKPKK